MQVLLNEDPLPVVHQLLPLVFLIVRSHEHRLRMLLLLLLVLHEGRLDLLLDEHGKEGVCDLACELEPVGSYLLETEFEFLVLPQNLRDFDVLARTRIQQKLVVQAPLV